MSEDLDEDFDDDVDFDSGGYDEGGGKKRLILLVVLPLLLVIGGAAGAYFSGLADPLLAMLGGEEPAATEEMADGEMSGDAGGGLGAGGAPVGSAIFYDLPEMLVNLNTPGRTRNFLKMRVSLELANENDITTIEMVLPRIVDNFQVYLRELRMEDLQGAAGMYRLREELLNRVNSAVQPARVNDVLFKEMIVQ
jgi:flagellar FliL protein